MAEIFLGKQASWADVKADYGARGDGTTDDTAAFQRAFDDLGAVGKSTTLYVPAGTYRISTTVNLIRKESVTIIGEDPATTTLKWAGPHNDGPGFTGNRGVMLLGQGSSVIRIGRMTLDGGGNLNWGIRWRWGGYNTSELFPSGMQHFDLIFKDMDVGIGAGCGQCGQQDTAEYSHVYRSQFIRCSYGGIVSEDYNSLLWGVIDSYFEDSAAAIRIQLGNINVYDSTFVRSTESDVIAGTDTFVGVRGNTSVGSAHFFTSTADTGTATLQNNLVLDPTGVAVDAGGELTTLIGNRFRTGTTAPVRINYAGVLSAGNSYSATTVFQGNQQGIRRQLDDVTGAAITGTTPARPAAPARYSGTIYRPAALTGAAVQTAIDQAAAAGGGLVYLGPGQYQVEQTITVPAGRDIRIVGEGRDRSTLIASNPSVANPVMRLVGPSHATLQDLSFHGGYNVTPTADELAITNADQAGGAVIIYGVNVVGPNTSAAAFAIDGVDDTTVELVLPHYFGGQTGSIVATGGPNAAARANDAPNIRMVDGFAGVGGGTNVPAYRLSAGARMIALENWGEAVAPNFLTISGSGNFTLSGGNFGYDSGGARNLVTAAGFSGRMSLLGMLIANGDLRISGANPNQNVLVGAARLDGWRQRDTVSSTLFNTSTAGTVQQYLTFGPTYSITESPNSPVVADAWLRMMLMDLRNDASRRNLLSTNTAVTAVQMRRLGFASGNTAVRISR